MIKTLIRLVTYFIVALFIILLIFMCLLVGKLLLQQSNRIDWNAIGSISGILMAIFTVVAIFVAIYIPQRDRITSSKIDLFNQRFAVYHFIFTRFSEGFECGKTHFDDAELMRQGMISDFLLSKSDNKELSLICSNIIEKINIKYRDPENPDPSLNIKNELDSIDRVFDKYLDLRNYGVEIDHSKPMAFRSKKFLKRRHLQ